MWLLIHGGKGTFIARFRVGSWVVEWGGMPTRKSSRRSKRLCRVIDNVLAAPIENPYFRHYPEPQLISIGD